jgi:ligand-binding sensor domain-containing protein
MARLDDQTLLVGTNYCGYDGCGLMAFDGANFNALDGFPSTATPGEEQVDYNIYALLVDDNKQIWVATGNGIALFDNEKDWNVFNTNTGLTNNLVYSLMQDSQGDIWAGTAAGGVDVFNWDGWAFEEKFNLTERGISDVHSIAEDSDKNYWFAGYNVDRYNSREDTWIVFSGDDGTLPVWGSTVLTIDDRDVVYVGSYEGLLRYTGKGFDHWYISNTVSSSSYGRIVPNGDGRLYFVSRYSNSSDVFNPVDGTWEWNTHSLDEAAPMAMDDAGDIWHGGSDGLWLYAENKTTHVTTEHGLPDNHINAIAVRPDGVAYLATDNGLAVFDGRTITATYDKNDMGIGPRITVLYLASDGVLWVTDEEGGIIAQLNPDNTWGRFEVNELFGIDTASITDFAETREGDLFVSTYGNGLFRLAQGEWAHILSTDPGVTLASDYINCITLAPDGSLWFGLSDGGATRFDGENWSHYDLQDGLINLTVHDIYVTHSGDIWFATEGGITRLQP